MDGSSQSQPGLRERKAAQTRLGIVAALRARLATTPLDEISVEDLAKDANVSRMTFFNYFPTKDHAVDTLMVVWIFQMEQELCERELRGVRAIEHVFAAMGDEMAAAPARMRRVFGHFALRESARPLPELSRADRLELAPRVALDREVWGLGSLLMRCVGEAFEDGELSMSGSSYELAHYLGALANGACLVGHSSPDTDWSQLFRRHVRRALGLFGVPGRKDPKPPRIPKSYKSPRKRREPS